MFLVYLCLLIIVYSDMNSKYRVFCIGTTLYYMLVLVPKIHQIYVYNIVERMIPKWTYVYRIFFHYILYNERLTSAFPSVLSVSVIMILKDIHFLIKHAENRLAKIEKILYEDGYKKRIVHLHNQIITEDMYSRFHQHCFDTNRLYLEDLTPSTTDKTLAINNYRTIRKNGNKPKPFQDDDEIFYKASSNKYIFISQRYSFYLFPIIVILWLMTMTDTTMTPKMWINHGILTADLLSMLGGTKFNDITIDFCYLVSIIYIFFDTGMASTNA